ncbi:extracellular solute-binding protein [Streptomyces sp. CA-210063]|uniref:extracellular solute-binding protein n=1 Tax=Streptomyces sp. CA-210063 TaxID=2801029 RepID=UPI00214CC61A|nr:extracellular solute-binding protein [Streptomyces sp. CA-210063]UUU30774.1 extracellular solute-binding protein [Streptomyces sp. CA-210063]
MKRHLVDIAAGVALALVLTGCGKGGSSGGGDADGKTIRFVAARYDDDTQPYKDIFDKAGISRPPSSWAEVEDAAEKMKKAGDIPLGLPLGAEEAQAEFSIWAMNNGGGWTDRSGQWAVDQRANVETLEFLRKLTKAGLTQPNPEATNRKDVFNQFAQGRIGMINGAVFMRKGFIDTVDKNLNYGVAPLPSKDGTTHHTLGVQDYLVAFKKDEDKNPEAVKKFLDFFYQRKNASKFLSTEGVLSVAESAGDALSSDAAYYKPFVDALSGARFAPTDNPNWATVEGAVKQRIGTAVSSAEPEEVLGEIQKTAEKDD